MLRINISTQPTRLDYTLRNAQTNLQSTQAKVQMETTPAKVEISQPRGELTIDMTPCRYSIGLKNITDFAKEYAERGKQIVMEATARIAQEGNQLARIENKSDAVSDIAFDSSLSEVDITWAPIAPPEIHYQANPAQFNPTAGKVNYSVQPGTVQGNFQHGSVDIRVTQYPSIEISTVDVKV
ncbi:MAG: hypothetical protein APF81_24925 [Desulfosporosinus sp. BRH_c37]|nr:MAG: hypothetical protein APF81_24925 [Desulfosporosinus sp. BRH_c37]